MVETPVFEIEIDLPLDSDVLKTTTREFVHAYDISEDVSEWDFPVTLNN